MLTFVSCHGKAATVLEVVVASTDVVLVTPCVFVAEVVDADVVEAPTIDVNVELAV